MTRAGQEPDFPADYADKATSRSGTAAAAATTTSTTSGSSPIPPPSAPYQGRAEPFPAGAIVLKEEYDFGDLDCSGRDQAVDRDASPGRWASPDTLDWAWQRVDAQRRVFEVETPCAASAVTRAAASPPDGYEWTCAVP
jgi:hypothetical protein